VIADGDLERFLFTSGHSLPSVESRRAEFPRWRRRLAEWGVESVPGNLQSQTPAECRAINLLTLLARQASEAREAPVEHYLRNLSGVRPEKP